MIKNVEIEKVRKFHRLKSFWEKTLKFDYPEDYSEMTASIFIKKSVADSLPLFLVVLSAVSAAAFLNPQVDSPLKLIARVMTHFFLATMIFECLLLASAKIKKRSGK